MTGRQLLEKLNELSEKELDNPVYDEYGQDLSGLSIHTELIPRGEDRYIQLDFGHGSDTFEEF